MQTWAIYQYDANNNVVARGINGRWTRHEYDLGTNQLLKTHRPHGDTITYGWDENGNRTSKTEGWQTVTYTYDAADRITGDTRWNGVYEHNDNGFLTQKEKYYNSVSFKYDALDRRITTDFVSSYQVGSRLNTSTVAKSAITLTRKAYCEA